jgi:hypothetical protein
MKRLLVPIVIVVGAAILTLTALYPQATVNMGRTYTGPLSVEYANEGVTGTTVNKLAKLTGAPSTVIITATTDTSGIVGIVVSGAGTTGSAQIAFKGKASCVFDSATTAGHYVSNDTSTAGDCMDAGATYPTSGQVIGVVTTTNGGAGTYVVDLTLGQPQAGGGGGGGATVTTIGALPGTCSDGTTFNFTNSLYSVVCDPANTFNYFFSTYPVTPPPSAGWSWDNQESATIDSTNGYEYLFCPRSGLGHVSVRHRAVPATPYFISAGFLWNMASEPPGGTISSRDVRGGLFFREAASGKLIAFHFGLNSTTYTLETRRWTNSTTASTTHATSGTTNQNILAVLGTKSPFWIGVSDDGVTNLKFFWSIDRQHWELFDTWARGDFFTTTGFPDQVGFGGYTGDSPSWYGLIHWVSSGTIP